ncbi:hypothetical protein [Sorangium sp. So ce381]
MNTYARLSSYRESDASIHSSPLGKYSSRCVSVCSLFDAKLVLPRWSGW